LLMEIQLVQTTKKKALRKAHGLDIQSVS
jgi:hypothetical protein